MKRKERVKSKGRRGLKVKEGGRYAVIGTLPSSFGFSLSIPC